MKTFDKAAAMAWFASGRPRWYSQKEGHCGGGACFTYEIGGRPGRFFDGKPLTGRRAGIGYVSYDLEYKGWVANYGPASCGGYEVMYDKENVALFDTVEEAKTVVEKLMPKMIEDEFRGIAEATVETIDKECGYFRDLLLPRGRRAAVNELLRLFWEDGGP